MESLTCNLCGSSGYSILFEAGVAQTNRIVRCNACGLLYANPRQRDADVDLIKDYDPEWVFTHATTSGQWRVDKENLQIRDYRTTRTILRQNYPNRGTLIEIGCGMGYLLNSFKKEGWNTVGIEPNRGLGLYARRQFGLEVVDGTLESAQLGPDSVDVAIMIHVIEHVPSPMSVFKEVHRLLKKGGCFVVETPRYDTLMFKLLGRRERSLSCDGHIYFFTTRTLARMAESAGFEIIRTDYVGRSMTMERLLYNLGVVSKSERISRALQTVSNRLRLNRLPLTLNLRDMQRIYLRKAA